MLEHLSFETSAVHAGGPQTAMKSFKDFRLWWMPTTCRSASSAVGR
jgi:hypothetical protein